MKVSERPLTTSWFEHIGTTISASSQGNAKQVKGFHNLRIYTFIENASGMNIDFKVKTFVNNSTNEVQVGATQNYTANGTLLSAVIDIRGVEEVALEWTVTAGSGDFTTKIVCE